MGKSIHFTGQPIFTQILSLIPRSTVSRLVRELKTDRYCKHFGTYEHLVTLLYATFNQCTSLREVISGMQAFSTRLLHLGVQHTPRRSTLADANSRRSATFFEQLYTQLYRQYSHFFPDSRQGNKLDKRLYIIDSTTISLFSDVLQGAGSYGMNGKKKGGIKAHVCLSSQRDTAAFIRLTKAKVNDNTFLQHIALPAGSIVVFDKGYRNYKKLMEWDKSGIKWVTRLYSRAVYQVQETRPCTDHHHQKGIISDEIILLGNPKTSDLNPLQKVRLVTYEDPATGRRLQFVTNQMDFAPTTIAGIYKKRWQIEIFFKRIKSSYQLHFFMGDNENAIRIQLWCAFIADLLISTIHQQVAKKKKMWSMANLAAFVRLHLTTYIDLIAFLLNPEKALIGYCDPVHEKQIKLFPT